MHNHPSAVREFFEGCKTLLKGFLWFAKHPKEMLLGLIPAAIVGSVFAALLIVLLFNIDSVTGFLSGFAEDWANGLRIAMEVAIGIGVVGGTVALSVLSFTALTLVVGDSFYTKIWKAVEVESHAEVPESEPTFVEGLVDGLSLFARGLVVAVIAILLGFIPVVGGVCAAVVGSALTGFLLADELTARAMNARKISSKIRHKFIRSHTPRSIGFGVATQLCFMVPLGAVITMPAAVVGATKLAEHVGNLEKAT